MSGKEKIERDFKTFTDEIEKLSDEETKIIREKIGAVEEQVQKVGEVVERSLGKSEGKSSRKKVNT